MTKSSRELLQNLTPDSAHWSSTKPTCENETLSGQPAEWLWAKMIEIYGATWQRERGKTPTSIWTQAIGKHAASDLKRALVKCLHRHSKWPPTLPEFLACLTYSPEDYGAPSEAQAWREAQNHSHEPTMHQWSHKAIRMAGRSVGWIDIQTAMGRNEQATRQRFETEYLKALALFSTGVKLLESDQEKPAGLKTQLASEKKAKEAAAEFDGINGPQALRLMRAMTGEKADD